MFSKVLIANRGAIAVRIIRTLRQLGVRAVAVYAEADRESAHVALADEAWSLGDGPAADTYLNQHKLFAVIDRCGAEAVHPGYGFLSENPDFCQACSARGIAFIGPTPAQMRLFGLKHTARDAARANGVPLLPGTDLLLDEDEALAAAEGIGYPVMLKSTAGGGGIGMQVCQTAGELQRAFASVRRLGASNFANDGVFLEKYISRARHIEVQVFGDGAGQAIALGERDCSAQRRNQKVIEESPAPGLSDDQRRALHATAAGLLASVHYRNAGTVEFLFDADSGEFYFLEVNTRLQVEHGVTEQVFDIDLVAWMVQLAARELPPLAALEAGLKPRGHAIQVRLYAEDPSNNFQPSAGLLTAAQFPEADGRGLRIDHWVGPGLTVSPFYDPMLAKLICHAETREQARSRLLAALAATVIEGIETNNAYCQAVLADDAFKSGRMDTRYLNRFAWTPAILRVLSPGTLTTVQDYPGRTGYWDVGVPPSGPFDSYSFRLGNRLLDNPEDAPGLEITLNGPTLRFHCAAEIALTGAALTASLDGQPVPFWQRIAVAAGQMLQLGKVSAAGARAYLLISGGIQCQPYLGSRATFTLGQFGGHGGRALRAGDVLHLAAGVAVNTAGAGAEVPVALRPALSHDWQLRVIYGPHGAPDFFTETDIETFFASTWKVHYNSSRTGVRLIGPKPDWARSDGGEAGMHPSNIHDNAYAIGTVDFTGDMPVILGPDGPSLGGFVCPATVISADLWKLGQLRAGDNLRFVPVSQDSARQLDQAQQQAIAGLVAVPVSVPAERPASARLARQSGAVDVVYRPSGDRYLLVEYGPQVLDIRLRFLVHTLMLHLQCLAIPGIRELTPGIRSLQIHYDSAVISQQALLALLQEQELALQHDEAPEVASRIVHLPLSWDDDVCRQAIDKYQESVRRDAPWYPSNIEFIRRINGLDSVEAVRDIIFNASYVVMGLGDVYLGAPVATPLDPRHRLVTTKYNPARTWTAENSVGIGGAYMCVYGMEGPGGYQLFGRTLQMWNRYRQTEAFSKPWLLRFFDQIRFYPVSSTELAQIRTDFPAGRYPLKIEETRFNLTEYEQFLATNADSIAEFTAHRDRAFQEELARWRESGQFHYRSDTDIATSAPEQELAQDCSAVESTVSGSVWKLCVTAGDRVEPGQVLCVVESMKMEIEITATAAGRVERLLQKPGSQVHAGQWLLILRHADQN